MVKTDWLYLTQYNQQINSALISMLIHDTHNGVVWRAHTLSANINLVFNTSRGVVAAAATQPATLPHNALSTPVTRPWLRPRNVETLTLSISHNGNCMMVNGISRMMVTFHPRYNCRATPRTEVGVVLPPPPEIVVVVVPSSITCLNAARLLFAPVACARCLTTSTGTRTAHAAISPSEEARMTVEVVERL